MWTKLLFAVLAIGGGLTACTTSTPPTPLTIVVTGTSAEPRLALSESLRTKLTAYAKRATTPGAANVRIISSLDGPVVERDLTPLRKAEEVDFSSTADGKIRAAIDELAKLVAATRATAPGLDLLSLLDRATQASPSSDIHVVSSGVTTEPPADLRVPGWSFKTAPFVDSLGKRGLLPNASGHSMTFHNLGAVAGSQPRLRPNERGVVERLWLEICQRSGARSCQVANDSPSGEPPIATQPVPVVPVADVETEGRCPAWRRLTDEQVRFSPDSAVLSRNADSVLQGIVAEIRRCDLSVDITGHIADTGPGDGRHLSQRRAQAVAERLLALGLPRTSLGNVAGLGDTEPLVRNWTNGRFDEAKARTNRRAELTFHPVGR